jgi:hypothetical protein
LLRLLTGFNRRGTSEQIVYRCANRCTWSKSTRPNRVLSVLDGKVLMAVRLESVHFADLLQYIFFIFIDVDFKPRLMPSIDKCCD